MPSADTLATAAWLFASTFAQVFALGLQSLNVNGGHYAADIFPGYFDGHVWIDCTGWPCRQTVIAWADLPAGSRAAR